MANNAHQGYAEQGDGCEFHERGLQLAGELLSRLGLVEAALPAVVAKLIELEERVESLEQRRPRRRRAA